MKILVAIPCMDTLDTMFVNSLLGMKKQGLTQIQFQSSSLVYDSRNKLALDAVEGEFDYILWLDSDMIFPETLLIDLLKSIEGKDFVTALAFARRPPFTPCIYKKIRLGEECETEQYLDYPKGIFEIDGCGFACCLMKTEMFKALEDIGDYRPFSPIVGFGEDLSACMKLKKLGYKLWCDSNIKVGHVARTVVTEDSYQGFRAYTERNK